LGSLVTLAGAYKAEGASKEKNPILRKMLTQKGLLGLVFRAIFVIGLLIATPFLEFKDFLSWSFIKTTAKVNDIKIDPFSPFIMGGGKNKISPPINFYNAAMQKN